MLILWIRCYEASTLTNLCLKMNKLGICSMVLSDENHTPVHRLACSVLEIKQNMQAAHTKH